MLALASAAAGPGGYAKQLSALRGAGDSVYPVGRARCPARPRENLHAPVGQRLCFTKLGHAAASRGDASHLVLAMLCVAAKITECIAKLAWVLLCVFYYGQCRAPRARGRARVTVVTRGRVRAGGPRGFIFGKVAMSLWEIK